MDFDFMDPPPQETMLTSLFDLWALGALSNTGDLTQLGSRMAVFPMEPSMSKLIIMSEQYGCMDEMLTIVSMLSIPSVFYRPKERAEESDAAREKFSVPESDHLTLLYIFQQWKAQKYSEAWCTKHFLHAKSLRRAREIRMQLQDICQKQRMRQSSAGSDWDLIRKCICSGYFHQAARLRGVAEYSNLRSGMVSAVHPTSALYGLGYLPEFVVYHQIMLTSKTYMSTVTAVDPYWLAELGGVFYSIKEKGQSKKATEHLMNKQMELEADLARARQVEPVEEVKKQTTRLATPGMRLARPPSVVRPGSSVVRPGSSVVRPGSSVRGQRRQTPRHN
ncbi:helicase associated domain-domain-containing protein [Protomyces lactucae-debilis]|uniref:Helicase associated domain-domain-containing protein n=1 Tax=Protomyces lactucae-debilis TaxID=2754530 RepID=A0A1Y2FFE9_PROLT|nr:helicase associated domain-containing protein [Protomyces lactucae-debilis]ORY82016.1 helicase associated domain-domain-containing protein [Protomyces lactucae-debilis]